MAVNLESMRMKHPEYFALLDSLKGELAGCETAVQKDLEKMADGPREERDARYGRFLQQTRPIREAINIHLGHLANIAAATERPLTIILARSPADGDTRPPVLIDGKEYWLTDRPAQEMLKA
jgi:hypothetical protein